MCICVYIYVYDCVKTNVGRPGFLSLNMAILSFFGCNAMVIVLRWFLFVKLVKPAELRWENGIVVVVQIGFVWVLL